MDSRIRWTSAVALTISTLSLALTGWLVACRTSDPTAGHAASPDAPVARATAAAVSIAMAAPSTPDPVAIASSSASPSAGPAQVPVVHDDANGKMRVRRIALSRSIKEREPVEPSTTFVASTDPLYAFVEIENQAASDGEIVISFEHKAKRTGNIELGIPAKHNRWRTWGQSRGVKEAGDWFVVVRTKGGKELIRAPFEVTPA